MHSHPCWASRHLTWIPSGRQSRKTYCQMISWVGGRWIGDTDANCCNRTQTTSEINLLLNLPCFIPLSFHGFGLLHLPCCVPSWFNLGNFWDALYKFSELNWKAEMIANSKTTGGERWNWVRDIGRNLHIGSALFFATFFPPTHVGSVGAASLGATCRCFHAWHWNLILCFSHDTYVQLVNGIIGNGREVLWIRKYISTEFIFSCSYLSIGHHPNF